MSNVDLKSCSDVLYHNEELKSLTRYRFDKTQERSQLKQAVSQLANILFPELEKPVSSLHIFSIYKPLLEYLRASYIASAHITKLTNLLNETSKGRYGKENAIIIRDCQELYKFCYVS